MSEKLRSAYFSERGAATACLRLFGILIFLLALTNVLKAECLPSTQAVRATHGRDAWSTYHTVSGHRCYMLGERHDRRTLSRDGADRRSARIRSLREIQGLIAHLPRSVAAPASRAPRMTLEAAYVEGRRLMAIYFAEQKAKLAEAGR